MALEYVYKALVGAQYTGQASTAAVLEAVQQISQLTGNNWTVQSDDGQVLVLREQAPGSPLYGDWPILAGQVVVIDPTFGIIDRCSVTQFNARYQREVNIIAKVLTAGLNNTQWIAALKTKLGIPGS